MVVATHSVEILSESDPHDVLVIDRHQEASQFADSHPALQRLVDHIGSSQNINLARLHATRKMLLVEGEDLDSLTHFHRLLFPYSSNSLATLPNLPVGGWGGWSYAIGSRMTLQNYVGGEITTYCILDSDYHTPQQISARYEEANTKGIQLHVWSRKEIENYLLVPDAISRVIRSRVGTQQPYPEPSQIAAQIDLIVRGLKRTLVVQLANEYICDDHRGGLPTAMQNAQRLANSGWRTREIRWGRVSGKEVLSTLSNWAHASFGTSFGPGRVLRELRADEIPREMADVLGAIETGRPLTAIRSDFISA